MPGLDPHGHTALMDTNPLLPAQVDIPAQAELPRKNIGVRSVRQERAAALLARGDLAAREVAEQVGVTAHTLSVWMTAPEFRARVTALAESRSEEILKTGLAQKIERVKIYDDLMGRMQQVMAERAAYAVANGLGDVPGMKTGLIVKQEKMIGTGASATQITEYVFDQSLFRSMLDVSRQISQELGQWIERRSVEGSVEHKVSLTDLRAALRGDPPPQTIEGEAREIPSPGADTNT